MSRGMFAIIAIGVILLAGAFYLGILDFGYWRSRVGYEVNSATRGLMPSGPSESPAQARSRAATCRENLRRIELAKRKAAAASGLTKADVTWAELTPHLGKQRPACPSGGTYNIGSTTVMAKCSISNNHTTDDADDHILKAF
ncbi:hypothetical protein GC173_12010 [bacterium]|nr:hypothetical protein [bacterium]